MWAWDAQQQFGWAGMFVAAAGAVRIWWVSRTWAVLVWGGYALAALFALTYNVGDAHVFFLPAHYFTAFAAGMAFAAPDVRDDAVRRPVRAAGRLMPAAALLMLAYAGWRGVDTWPAADRHLDTRAATLMTRLTAGVTEQDALLVSGMNWEVENALLYAGRHEHARVAWLRVFDVLPHFPFLVRDNLSIGRDIVLTEGAAAMIVAAYGDAFPILQDEVPPVRTLTDTAGALPPGTPYVLTHLEPLRDYPYDPSDVGEALRVLTGSPRVPGDARYQVIAGEAGRPPSYVRDADRPFRDEFSLVGETFTVRMDAWLPTDTFRRGGFGHVVRGRRPVLTVERGVSLMAIGRDGQPSITYVGGPYAARQRYRIPAGGTRLALGATVGLESGFATHPGTRLTGRSRNGS
jgi:hypothetical protein